MMKNYNYQSTSFYQSFADFKRPGEDDLELKSPKEFELYMNEGLNEMINAFKNVHHTALNDLS